MLQKVVYDYKLPKIYMVVIKYISSRGGAKQSHVVVQTADERNGYRIQQKVVLAITFSALRAKAGAQDERMSEMGTG
jgi:hypothetical protein